MFFAQIGLAITFTTNYYVKRQMLHVMRDADDISRVKTAELIADVIIEILHAVLCYKYLVLSKKLKILIMPKRFFLQKTAFSRLKNWHYRIVLNFAQC